MHKFLDYKKRRINPDRNIFKINLFDIRKLCSKVFKMRPHWNGKIIFDRRSKLNLLDYESVSNNQLIITTEESVSSTSSDKESDDSGHALDYGSD